MSEEEFKKFMDKVFEAIREKRKDLGLSQGELSSRMQKPQSSIARLEAGGVRDPRISMFFQLGKALGVNPAEILGLAFDELEGDSGSSESREWETDWRMQKIKNRLDMLDGEQREAVAEIVEGVLKLT